MTMYTASKVASKSLSSSSAYSFEEAYIQPALARRRENGSLRKLTPYHSKSTLDFSSNDYLGLAQSGDQHRKVQEMYHHLSSHYPSYLGSSGSRLLTGDSNYCQELEIKLAKWHNRPSALICNSGYDANLSVVSCLTRNAIVIMDELCHNSLLMGIRLNNKSNSEQQQNLLNEGGQGQQQDVVENDSCTVHYFAHNSVTDLERIITNEVATQSNQSKEERPILIIVESVYSMDGDVAPLREILDLASQVGASVIVDEAHGLGVFGSTGMGVLSEEGLEQHPALLASVHTFGKAAGCHGAVVCGSHALKEFLINFGRPIIYSTSLPFHSLVTIQCSYESMVSSTVGGTLRSQLTDLVAYFQQEMESILGRTNDTTEHDNHTSNNSSGIQQKISLVPSVSPIQSLLIPGNETCVTFCNLLWDKSNHRVRLYPIRSPTVPKGQERVRIIIHSHNTKSQIGNILIPLIEDTLIDMGYLRRRTKQLAVSRL